MAFDTGNISMGRILNILSVDCHGDLFSFDSFEHIVFVMTDETFPVGRTEDQRLSFEFVGEMTIGAGRYGPGLLFPEFTLDDLDMDLFNPGVAFGTGSGNISCRNA